MSHNLARQQRDNNLESYLTRTWSTNNQIFNFSLNVYDKFSDYYYQSDRQNHRQKTCHGPKQIISMARTV